MSKKKLFEKKNDLDSNVDDVLDSKSKTETKSEVNSNLNIKDSKMSEVMNEEQTAVAAGVAAAINADSTDSNLYVIANREMKFRNQLRYEEETGNETRLPGVEYFEFETDKDGNNVLENGEPKQIIYRQKPGLRRKPITVQVRYPLLAYFGISTDISGEFNKATTSYPKPEFQTLFEGIQSTIDEAVDSWMNNEKTAATPPTFEQVSWEVISSTPKSSRKSIQISREDLIAAIESYCEVMQGLGKSQKGIEITQQVFKTRCRQAYMLDPAAIKAIRGNLATWFDTISDEKKAEFQDVFAFLDRQLEQAMAEVDITDIL